MKDLYKILGVTRNVSLKGIQNAYRKQAKKHHPDRGGDPEKFREVTEAYDVLSDPERRHRYDATGETDKPVDNREALLATAVARAYSLVLEKLLPSNKDLTKVDLVAEMKQALDTKIQEIEKNLPEVRKVKARLEQVAERLEDEQGLLKGAAQYQAAHVGRQIEAVEKELHDAKLAHDYLRGCKYRFDPKTTREQDIEKLERLMRGIGMGSATMSGSWSS